MADIRQMIEAHIPKLRRYARALVRDIAGADDLLQASLARALVKQHLWQDGTDLRAWLFAILHNQHVNQVRRSIRTGAMAGIDNAAPLPSQPASQDKRLELRDLDRALGRLAPEQRTVILLIGLEGMPYAEVGALLGIPVGTVRSRLSRGRQALRRLMGLDELPTRRTVPDRAIVRSRKPRHTPAGSAAAVAAAWRPGAVSAAPGESITG